MSESLQTRIAALRSTAHKAAAHPLLPSEGRKAISELTEVTGELATEVDWVRRDLVQLEQRLPTARPSAPSAH